MKILKNIQIVVKIMVAVALLTTIGCVSTLTNSKNRVAARNQEIMVRLTTYSRDEKLSKKHRDPWSRRGISSTGVPLKNMESVAVDPHIIPYFSRIKLSCLNHPIFAIDTGSAVKQRVAALRWGINCPVIELFFDHERDAAEFRRRNPMFVEAKILN